MAWRNTDAVDAGALHALLDTLAEAVEARRPPPITVNYPVLSAQSNAEHRVEVGKVRLRGDVDPTMLTALIHVGEANADLVWIPALHAFVDRSPHGLLRQIGGVGRLHKPRVEQAGFAVLKAPDIPSVLVETAFISNPEEEEKLRSERYQDQLVDALMRGIVQYFSRNPPLARSRGI